MSIAVRQSVPASRLEALLSRHAAADLELREEQMHFANDDTIRELKRKKLHLKEEIEQLRQSS